MDVEAQKQRAAERALDYVRNGMTIGLGTGSTAARFVELVGARVKAGLDVLCVPTSQATRVQAEGLNIPLSTLDALEGLDLTVDGADELDDELRLIKGGGGALLREKIVAAASERMVVIADAGKRVSALGAYPLPVEVDPFGWRATRKLVLAAIGEAGCAADAELRHTSDSEIFVSDGGNYILDCALGRIPDPERLASLLSAVPGVVEHGLFIGLAHAAVIADEKDVEIIGEAP